LFLCLNVVSFKIIFNTAILLLLLLLNTFKIYIITYIFFLCNKKKIIFEYFIENIFFFLFLKFYLIIKNILIYYYYFKCILLNLVSFIFNRIFTKINYFFTSEKKNKFYIFNFNLKIVEMFFIIKKKVFIIKYYLN